MAAIFVIAWARSMIANKATKIGGLLLAAGSSSRLGQPKQLLVFEGKTLIRRSAEVLIESGCEPVVVVLGAETEACTEELAGLSVTIHINSDWPSGMGSSIASGLGRLQTISSNLDAVMVALCDQPHVTTQHLKSLITEFQTSNAEIVAAEYGQTIGVPAVFAREIFPDLKRLDADKGARDIIRNHASETRTVPIDAAKIDIDTLSDYEALV